MSLHSFTIDEATITVWPTDANGDAITSNPVWLGAGVEGVRISEALEETEDRPSGTPYPVVHHGAESHQIDIERLWEVQGSPAAQPANLSVTLAATDIGQPLPANGQDYRLRPGMTYILTIVWEDDRDPDRWHWRVYYGVTDRSHEVRGSGQEGKRSAISLRAQYYLDQ